MKYIKNMLIAAVLFVSANAFAVNGWSAKSHEIMQVQANAVTGSVWVLIDSPLNYPGCPGTRWLELAQTDHNAMAEAVLLGARFSGKKLMFYGDCRPGSSNTFRIALVK